VQAYTNELELKVSHLAQENAKLRKKYDEVSELFQNKKKLLYILFKFLIFFFWFVFVFCCCGQLRSAMAAQIPVKKTFQRASSSPLWERNWLMFLYSFCLCFSLFLKSKREWRMKLLGNYDAWANIEAAMRKAKQNTT